MPTYLLHGFRWPRGGFTGIRVFVVLHNLEDAAAEYIQQPVTSRLILDAFRKHEPEIMARLEGSRTSTAAERQDPGRVRLRFIEQYDPDDVQSETAVSQPFAYVADRVIPFGDGDLEEGGGKKDEAGAAATASATATARTIGIDLEEVMNAGPGISEEAAQAFADLRDKYAAGEKIGWYLVYNGDPERSFPHDEEEEEVEEEQEGDEDEEAVEGEQSFGNEDEDEGVGLHDDDQAGKRGKSARRRKNSSANADAQPSRPTVCSYYDCLRTVYTVLHDADEGLQTSRGLSGKLSRLFIKKKGDSVTP